MPSKRELSKQAPCSKNCEPPLHVVLTAQSMYFIYYRILTIDHNSLINTAKSQSLVQTIDTNALIALTVEHTLKW